MLDVELNALQHPSNPFVVLSLIELRIWEEHVSGVLKILEEVDKILWQSETELALDRFYVDSGQTLDAVPNGLAVADVLPRIEQVEEFWP